MHMLVILDHHNKIKSTYWDSPSYAITKICCFFLFMFSYYTLYIIVYIRIGQVYQEQFFVDGKENIEKFSIFSLPSNGTKNGGENIKIICKSWNTENNITPKYVDNVFSHTIELKTLAIR